MIGGLMAAALVVGSPVEGPTEEGPAQLSAAAAAPAPHVPESGEKDGRIHLPLSGAALYGIAGQSFLGANLRFNAGLPVWASARATGTFDFGAQFQYANEPTWLAPWLRGVDVEGATHRVVLAVTVGHTFHLGRRRRLSLGTHLYGGLNHWVSSYSLRYPDEGVEGSANVARSLFVGGGQLEFGYRFSRRVGMQVLLGAPFPINSSYAQGLFFAGLGLTVHLR